MTFHLLCVYIILSWVAEWPLFGKELLTRLIMCSLCILTICNFSCSMTFCFSFEVLVKLNPIQVNIKGGGPS